MTAPSADVSSIPPTLFIRVADILNGVVHATAYPFEGGERYVLASLVDKTAEGTERQTEPVNEEAMIRSLLSVVDPLYHHAFRRDLETLIAQRSAHSANMPTGRWYVVAVDNETELPLELWLRRHDYKFLVKGSTSDSSTDPKPGRGPA